MSRNNVGKDFLFSKDCGFIDGGDGDSYRYSDGSGYYHGADGSEGYIYSDGSGYFHGADGSDGYVYSDGSAYYHGADGTDAYKYSDGSGYYHGADGSDGYKYSDGSGSFNGAGGDSYSYNSYDSDDDYEGDDDNNDSDTDWVLGLAGLTIGLGAAAIAKSTEKAREEARKEEEKRLELERIAEEKRRMRREKREHDRKIRKKRLKALFFNKKNLQMEFSTTDLVGEDYREVMKDLEEVGFDNCRAIAVKDIYVGSNKYVGEVEQVVINGQSYVGEGTMVPYDAEIIITYHLKREIEFPFDQRMVTKMNFEQVADRLLDLGYTEVYTLPLKDLKTGWIKKEKSVQKILIAGVESVKKGIVLEYDKKITIQYHSFAKK